MWLTGAAIQEFCIEIPDKDADTIHSGKPASFCPRKLDALKC